MTDLGNLIGSDCVFRCCARAGDRPEAIEFEADARHVEITLSQPTFLNGKAVVTPGVTTDSVDLGAKLPPGNTHTPFRSLCMRTSYLTDDRPDVRFADKESAKLMSEPCVAGWDNVDRTSESMRQARTSPLDL